MNAPKLLLDFGASRVKAALYDPDQGRIVALSDVPAPEPEFGAAGEVEVDPWLYPRLVGRVLEGLPPALNEVDAAVLCVEMHGFILVGPDGAPRSRYVSWRDARATFGENSLLARVGPEARATFRARTGMTLRAGLPVLTAASMAAAGELDGPARLLSLAEWLAVCGGAPTGRVHESLAAASGFYDLNARGFDLELGRYMTGPTPKLSFNTVVTDAREPIGALDVRGRHVPLIGGIGDLQAAFLGSGCGETEACLNLGTGSQVLSPLGADSAEARELRPLVDGRRLQVISHIPSGRALTVFSRLVDEIASAAGGAPGLLWRRLAEVTKEEALAGPLAFDLNVFPAAWRFDGGGGITGVREGGFGLGELTASLVRSYATQYRDALALIDPEERLSALVIAGGVGRRIPALAPVLEQLTRRPVRHSGEEEETLAGLASLA